MTTLPEFLTACITDDEADVRRAYGWDQPQTPGLPFTWDHPARTRILCTAVRQVLELHVRDEEGECAACGEGSYGCPQAGEGDRYEGTDWPCPTLRALAQIWADHPDYQQEWAL